MAIMTIALPKGRLLEPSVNLFRGLGYRCALGEGSRRLIGEEPTGDTRFILAKAEDIPVYVEYGAADMGIAGQDIVRESGRDVYEPLALGFGHCRLVVAGLAGPKGRDFRLASGLRIATKYQRLSREYFLGQGISVEIVRLYGSIELAPKVGLADLLVDVVETGRTLRENGLVELQEIMPCQAALIVNRASHKLRLAQVSQLVAAIRRNIPVEG